MESGDKCGEVNPTEILNNLKSFLPSADYDDDEDEDCERTMLYELQTENIQIFISPCSSGVGWKTRKMVPGRTEVVVTDSLTEITPNRVFP